MSCNVPSVVPIAAKKNNRAAMASKILRIGNVLPPVLFQANLVRGATVVLLSERDFQILPAPDFRSARNPARAAEEFTAA
jgi:hypothetical protein